jgi:hypothetical protein
MELAKEAEVEVGEVNEDRNMGTASSDGALEFAKFAVDAGQVFNHLGEAHDSHIFSADDAVDAGGAHALAAHAYELGLRQFLAQKGRQLRAVKFAAGFAG